MSVNAAPEPMGVPAAVSPSPSAGTRLAGSAPVSCPSCGHAAQSPRVLAGPAGVGQLVYAVGRLSAQICSIEVDRAFAQLTAGQHEGDQVEVELLQQVLAKPQNAWLGQYLGWTFTSASDGVDIFSVVPRNDADVTRLAEMLAPTDEDDLIQVVVGKTVLAPADSPCAALGLPAVQADRVLAFTLQEFAARMPLEESPGTDKRPAAGSSKADRAGFDVVVRQFFRRLTQVSGNHGFTPEHIASNFLATEFVPLYLAVWQALRDDKILVGVDTRHVHSADRRIVAVRVTLRQRQTEITEPYQIIVDATKPPGAFVVSGPRLVYD